MPAAPSDPFEKRLLAGFIAGATILLLLAALIWSFSRQAVDATRFVLHTHEVLGSIGQLQFQLYRAEAEQRGYLISSQGSYIGAFRQSVAAMRAELDRLEKLVDGHPMQTARVELLRADIDYRVSLLEKNISLVKKSANPRPDVTDGTALDRRIDSLLADLQTEEQRLLVQRQQLESARAQVTAIGFATLVLLLALAVPMLYFRFRNAHRDKLAASAETARLIAVIDGSPDLIATSTPSGEASYVNRAGRELLGIGNMPVADIRREAIYAPWALHILENVGIPAAVASGSWRGETAFRTADGREVPVSQVVVCHRHANGSMTLSTIARDISALKEAEKQLAEKNRQVEQASRMKTEFLATMSHELRTPLNAIIGFSSVIRDGQAGDVSPSAREYANDILDSGRHLLALINDILDLSTIESGNLRLSLGMVDGEELAASGMAIIREQANSRGIRLAQSISPELKSIWVDARKTRQIIFNLLSNAVKFSSDGGEVRLGLQLVPRARIEQTGAGRCQRLFPLPPSRFSEFLEIRVSDNGVGISTADLYRLFQPFTQLDSSRNRPHEGTGLGLVMVRRLAELQNGAMLVESAPGQGSCFTVWLPLRDPENQEPLPPDLRLPMFKSQFS